MPTTEWPAGAACTVPGVRCWCGQIHPGPHECVLWFDARCPICDDTGYMLHTYMPCSVPAHAAYRERDGRTVPERVERRGEQRRAKSKRKPAG